MLKGGTFAIYNISVVHKLKRLEFLILKPKACEIAHVEKKTEYMKNCSCFTQKSIGLH